MNCPKCGSTRTGKNGTRNGIQMYRCYECKGFFHEKSKIDNSGVPKETEVPKENPGIKGLTEAELRARHDNCFILSQMITKLSPGKFLARRDFVLFCNFKQGTGYRQAMEDHQYDLYHGTAGGVVYWGCKEDIQRLKNECVLR